MKTNTNTHHTSSRSRSFKMNITLALLAIIFLPLLAVTTSAQGYYRNYTTGAYNVQNEARCIIKPGGGLYKFLSVGQFWEPYLPSSGHAIWAKANGVLDIPTGPLFLPVTNASKYNRVGYQDYSDYSLNFVEETMTSGNFNPGSSYSAHPATGVKTYLEDGVLYSNTWTTLIDPLTKNTIWDHVIYNAQSDISFGIGVVTDPNGFDFYVVSHISNVVDATLQRVGVTKYEYIFGNNGHQVAWSREYVLEGYTLAPVGIVDAGNDVVVAGNLNPGGKIFTLVIDKATGFISRQIYTSDPIVLSLTQ
ncbi:MAG: hypothetical protein IPM69_06240 [Ignavibacteria bacterium]|nr:hypothetical protein [Ignavibacteria bacterium]